MTSRIGSMTRISVQRYKTEYTDRVFKNPPKVVTFDAYNTLYSTRVPVFEHYCMVGEKYGLKSDLKSMLENYPSVYKTLNFNHPFYGKHTNITPNEWWSMFIKNCFKPLEVPDLMVQEILTRFEGTDAYCVYADLVPFLDELKKTGCIVAVVSNTDPVMYNLMRNLKLFEYFKDNIYLSYDIELKKPNPLFFEHVLQKIVQKHPHLLENGLSMEELKSKYCYHIGDELENDLLGSKSANLNGILVDRANIYGYFTNINGGTALDAEKLATDKIDKNHSEVWEKSSTIDDVVTSDDNHQLVVSNFKVLTTLLEK